MSRHNLAWPSRRAELCEVMALRTHRSSPRCASECQRLLRLGKGDGTLARGLPWDVWVRLGAETSHGTHPAERLREVKGLSHNQVTSAP
jgi:hypothetical protein